MVSGVYGVYVEAHGDFVEVYAVFKESSSAS